MGGLRPKWEGCGAAVRPGRSRRHRDVPTLRYSPFADPSCLCRAECANRSRAPLPYGQPGCDAPLALLDLTLEMARRCGSRISPQLAAARRAPDSP